MTKSSLIRICAALRTGETRAGQLYLVSPLDVGGAFPDRLAEALAAGPVAAFQFRVKGIDQHEAARLAEPLQALCAAREVAFIVNDDMAWRSGSAPTASISARTTAIRATRGRCSGQARRSASPVHDSRHLAMEAGEAGADYVAFGAFYPTAPRRRGIGPIRRSSAGGRPCSRSLRRDRRHHPENGGCWSRRARISSPSAARCGDTRTGRGQR
jgi:hypothetical protein